MVGFRARIAAIERLHPDERRRRARLPLITARAGGDAADGYRFLERHVSDAVSDVTGAVPHFYFVRKIFKRADVRIRMMNERDENESAVWREFRGFVNSGLAYGSGFIGGDVDECELRCCIVIEKLFVTRAREQVFKCWSGRGLAKTFLNNGPFRNARRSRRGAVTRRNCTAKQFAAIGRPRARSTGARRLRNES